MTYQQGADQPFVPQQGPPPGPPAWHSQTAPSSWGIGAKDRAAPWAMAAVVVLAASEWASVLHEFGLRELDLSFSLDNIFWVLASAGVWATAGLAAAAAVMRSGALLTVVAVIGGLHLLTFVGILAVQTVLSADGHMVSDALRGLGLVIAALGAMALGFVAWRRDRAGRPSALFAVLGVVLALVATVAHDLSVWLIYSEHLAGPLVPQLVTHARTMVFFAVILLLGLRSAVMRWMGVGLAFVGLVWLLPGLVRDLGADPQIPVLLVTTVLYLAGYAVALGCGVVAARRTRSTGRL